MAEFEEALRFVLAREGGYTDGKSGVYRFDRGGATHFGITLRMFQHFRINPALTMNDLEQLEFWEAKAIYEKNFWTRLRLKELNSQALATIIFDQAVNRGPGTVTIQIQQVLNQLDFPVTVDGSFGPKTVQALNSVNYFDLALNFISRSQQSYIAICVKNPDQLVFLKGWMARTHELLKLLAERQD